jgi:hypothetical protein
MTCAPTAKQDMLPVVNINAYAQTENSSAALSHNKNSIRLTSG